MPRGTSYSLAMPTFKSFSGRQGVEPGAPRSRERVGGVQEMQR